MSKATRSLSRIAGISVVMLCCVAVAAYLDLIPLPGDSGVSASRSEQASDATPCGRCGFIEAVREVGIGRSVSNRTVAAAALAQQLGGFSSVTNVLGLALVALAGKLDDPAGVPSKLYETTIRFADGSLRVLTEANPPERKPGDAVKVVSGRIYALQAPLAPVLAQAVN